ESLPITGAWYSSAGDVRRQNIWRTGKSQPRPVLLVTAWAVGRRPKPTVLMMPRECQLTLGTRRWRIREVPRDVTLVPCCAAYWRRLSSSETMRRGVEPDRPEG